MNPEFRRNLWLEMTTHRLVAAPVVLAVVFGLVHAASGQRSAIVAASAVILAIVLGVWGIYSAGDAVPSEVRARTWDSQRMSAIGPWAMTWGKLLGSTVFAWYGAGIALAVLVLVAPTDWRHSGFKVAALIVSLSLLAQAFACTAGVMLARKGQTRQGAVGGILVLFAFLMFMPGASQYYAGEPSVMWWGVERERMGFALSTGIVFAAWSVFGLYRVLCVELQLRTLPWASVGFILFLSTYLAGFFVGPAASMAHARDVLLICAFLVATIFTYLFLFIEETGVIVFRRAGVRFMRGNISAAVGELPCWPAALALVALFAVSTTILTGGGSEPAIVRGMSQIALPMLLLLVRDIGLYLVFAFARQARRTEITAFFYLLLVYALLPWLLHAAGLPGVARLVLPPILERPAFSIAVIGVHCVLVWGAVLWRWRTHEHSRLPT